MNELALFAGAGGGLLGSLLCGWRTVAAVELDRFRRERLLQRQAEGYLDFFPIWDDVKTFDGRPFRGCVDIITGGDPCQSNSAAYTHGSRAESLAAHFLRVVEEVRPRWVIRENPAKVRKDAPWPADRFAAGLSGMGYATAIVEIRACCLGANHQRGRLFVLGEVSDADKGGCHTGRVAGRRSAWTELDWRREGARLAEGSANADADLFDDDNRGHGTGALRPQRSESTRLRQSNDGDAGWLAYTYSTRLQKRPNLGRAVQEETAMPCRDMRPGKWWEWERSASRVCGVDDGVAARVDRVAAIGDGQVPGVVRAAWCLLRATRGEDQGTGKLTLPARLS